MTVNIFVPDIDPYENGVLVEDGERTEELEKLADAWVESLTAEVSCYLFKLQQTIYTEAEPDINQHFVVVKLKYKYFGNDDAPLNIPQSANIDAIDTEEDDSYLSLLETEDGSTVEITPVVKKQY